MIRSAMIMAAGLGTRLKPFTDRIPKPFVPVMGIPAIQFVIDSLAEAGVTHCVLNSHHLHEATLRNTQLLDWHGMRVQVSDESKLLLGSGGGIARAATFFGGEPFFLANADVLFDLSWKQLALRHALLRRTHGVWMTLTLTAHASLGGAYREILTDPKADLVAGLGTNAEDRPFYAGAAVIESEAVAHLTAGQPYDFVPAILNPAIAAVRVGADRQDGIWLDVGSPELWARTHFHLIHELERGGLRGPSSRGWAARLEKHNRRYAPGIWAARTSQVTASPDWQGPIYLAGEIPEKFSTVSHGPELVAYDLNWDGKAMNHTARMEDLSADFIASTRVPLNPNP